MTLDCPSDCVYLQQAREHEKPRGMADVNPADLFLQVEVGDDFLYQREHLIMGLTFALAKSVRADRSLKDSDLIAALTSLAKNYRDAGQFRIALRDAHSPTQRNRRWRWNFKTC